MSSAGATISDCLIIGNSAWVGGGLYLVNSSSHIQNNEILSNTADGGAAAIASVSGGAPLIEKNLIIGNETGYYGGGIFLGTSPARVKDNTLFTNRVIYPYEFIGSVFQGGGIDIFWTTGAVFENNFVMSNLISSTFGTGYSYGAGISISDGSQITLTNNIVENNHSYFFGGGINIRGSSGVLVSGNQIQNNVSALEGGGIHIEYNEYITLENNIIADNHSPVGSGGLVSGLSPGGILFTHNTIANNRSPDVNGAGIFGSFATLSNTILVSHTTGIMGNFSMNGTLWGNETDWKSFGYITTGTVNLWGNPAFVDPANGDYHIGPDSVAIDAGIDQGVTTDIDNQIHPFGTGFDIGADEYVPIPPTPTPTHTPTPTSTPPAATQTPTPTPTPPPQENKIYLPIVGGE